MRKPIFKITALVMCFAMALACIPVYSMTAQAYPDEYSMEKLLAFWQQEAHDGLTNGDAVYAIDWSLGPEHYNSFGGSYPVYGGTWATKLVNCDNGGSTFQFHFGYRESFWVLAEIFPGYPTYADGYEYAFPDLYGDLDLSGTNLGIISPLYFMNGWDEQTSTHIETIELNNCSLVSNIIIPGQEHLEKVSALNCPRLAQFTVTDCACTELRFRTADMGRALYVNVVGSGAVGAEYTPETHKVYTYPSEGSFVCWYLNGELLSTEQVLTEQVDGRLTAVFAGDADNDGLVDSADALLILHSSMGILQGELDQTAADVNCDGCVDSADALLIMRVTLGLV